MVEYIIQPIFFNENKKGKRLNPNVHFVYFVFVLNNFVVFEQWDMFGGVVPNSDFQIVS
jgi:hypothetical protein